MAVGAAPSGPYRGRSSFRGISKRAARVQPGLLLGPFVVALGLTLMGVMATGTQLTGGWVLMAALVGVIASACTIVVVLNAHHPARTAGAASQIPLKPHQEAMGGDPLAHIHVMEQQARRHRRPCVNCGTPVQAGAERCANCDHQQLYSCKGCRTQVRLDWTNCPECGRGLP